MSTLNKEFLEQLLNEAAWKKLSEDFYWTKETLEKCQDEVNWKSISGNSEIAWTASMLAKFKDRIDWTELSSCAGKRAITAANLEKFKEYWNWSELSGNTNFNLTEKIIDKYIDLWDWEKLIERWRDDRLFSVEFFEKYADRMPLSTIQSSSLWSGMVEQRKLELESELD